MNFNMHNLEKTLNELHGMLKTVEQNIVKKRKNDVLVVQKGKGFKRHGTKKGKGKGKTPVKNWKNNKVKSEPKPNPQVEMLCFHCNEKGHWKRNSKKYLEEKKGMNSSKSGVKKE
ncbi:unnamed protein product [Cuscuta europaea]|uniref:Uncharacterized protein n=1 Tax=Cuscuta europaea TaxID=41803 RepID=A0A9P0ZSF2_CUSEU|nr:unnamed protein product [Cuscuta europaea]